MRFKQGLFINIDGLDGTGKTTTEKVLLKILKHKTDLNILFTKEPDTSTYVGKQLRNILVSNNNNLTKQEQAVVFALNRRWHINKIVKPALEQNKLVISDRYLTSSLAYQGDYQSRNGSVIDINNIMRLNESVAHVSSCKPDLDAYLYLDPADEIRRINYRKNGQTNKFDHFDRMLEQPARIRHLQYQYKYALRDMDVPSIKINAKKGPKDRAMIIYKAIMKLVNKKRALTILH